MRSTDMRFCAARSRFPDGDISFPYLLMPGRATSRNAIRLLEMMGYSEEIIKKADDQAAEFLKTGVWKA